MSNLLEMLTSKLGDDQVGEMANQLGASKEQTQSAISAALPTLLAALGRQAQDPQTAEQLHSAVERDHDGSVLDSIGGLLSGGSSDVGQSILGHILGGKQSRVENAIGQTSGLDASKAGSLMSMLAPMVMGALGKQQREQGLGASDMASMLQNERQSIESSQSGSFLGKMLDQDGDGDFDMSDMMKFGMSKLFGKN